MARNNYRRRGRKLMTPGLAGMVVTRAARDAVLAATRGFARRAATRGGVGALAAGSAATTGYLGYKAQQRKATEGVKKVDGRKGKWVRSKAGMSSSVNVPSVYNGNTSKEVSNVNYNFGVRSVPKALSLKNLSKITTATATSRWQNVAGVDKVSGGADRGAFWLGSMYTASNTLNNVINTAPRANYVEAESQLTASNFLRTGYHMYCLNNTQYTNATQQYSVGIQPFVSMSTGNISFAGLQQIDLTQSNLINSWNMERSDNGAAATYDRKYIRQDWYDIKLALRNAQAQQSWFDIWVFQFKDGYLDPHETPSNIEEASDRRAFYQGLAAMGYRNPILPQSQMKQPLKKVNIIRKMRIYFNKQHTDESDLSPDIKYVNLHIKDGKLYDYQYTDSGVTPNDSVLYGDFQNLLLGSAYKSQGTNALDTSLLSYTSDIPKPRARLWLMISAYDPRLQGVSGEDITDYSTMNTNNNTSYDIVIRKHETFASDR